MAIIGGFVLWRTMPLVGLVLAILTVVGAIALRVRDHNHCLLGFFGFFILLAALYEGTLAVSWIQRHTYDWHPIELAVLIAVCLSHIASFISAIRLMRASRVQMLLEDSISQFEMDDLELQQPQEEEYDAPPAYVAAPAYYPQFNENFMPAPASVPQFTPVFIDAAGKPIVPIQTQ